MKVYDKLFSSKPNPGVVRIGEKGDGIRLEVIDVSGVWGNSVRIKIGQEKNAALFIDKRYAGILRDFFTDLEASL